MKRLEGTAVLGLLAFVLAVAVFAFPIPALGWQDAAPSWKSGTLAAVPMTGTPIPDGWASMFAWPEVGLDFGTIYPAQRTVTSASLAWGAWTGLGTSQAVTYALPASTSSAFAVVMFGGGNVWSNSTGSDWWTGSYTWNSLKPTSATVSGGVLRSGVGSTSTTSGAGYYRDYGGTVRLSEVAGDPPDLVHSPLAAGVQAVSILAFRPGSPYGEYVLVTRDVADIPTGVGGHGSSTATGTYSPPVIGTIQCSIPSSIRAVIDSGVKYGYSPAGKSITGSYSALYGCAVTTDTAEVDLVFAEYADWAPDLDSIESTNGTPPTPLVIVPPADPEWYNPWPGLDVPPPSMLDTDLVAPAWIPAWLWDWVTTSVIEPVQSAAGAVTGWFWWFPAFASFGGTS